MAVNNEENFRFIGLIVSNPEKKRVLLMPVLGGVASVGHYITDHKQTQ